METRLDDYGPFIRTRSNINATTERSVYMEADCRPVYVSTCMCRYVLADLCVCVYICE